MICLVDVSKHVRIVYEIKTHYQSPNLLSQDKRNKEKNLSKAVRGRDDRILYGKRLMAEREIYMEWDVPKLDHKHPFY